ncbi:peptide deformylase [Patescibacteria group bacterium]|nr:peptide deformylase [Patescibacteria group bacterium]
MKILKYPEKVLRVKGKEVGFPLTKNIKHLIKEMHITVKKAEGIGLAAPQVGKSLRIVVINLEHLGIPAFTLINPEITFFSKTQTDLEEGCLSIPGVYGIVARPEKIRFTAHNEKGEKVSASADGMLSKVIQHEVDHINGVLIIDKIKKYTQGNEIRERHFNT